MSLRFLNLRDFVIVPALEVRLDEGFTALTGETGAGKSILIDALQLALGSRGDAIWVREGAQRCEIAAAFDAPQPGSPLELWCQDQGFELESEELLVRRVIDQAGKSRAWINGAAATLGQLRELGSFVVDIHGQHEWQALMRPASMRTILDFYGRINNKALLDAWQTWQGAVQQLQAAQQAQEALALEREALEEKIELGEKLSPGPDEWTDLNLRHQRLSNAQALIEAAQGASHYLDGGEESAGEMSPGALPLMAQAISALTAQARIEPEFAQAIEIVQSCCAQLSDVSHSLHAYLGRTETDADQLALLDERIASWLSLARRWRIEPQEAPSQLEAWRARLTHIEAQSDLHSLLAKAEEAEALWRIEAQSVSAARAKGAAALGEAITQAMQQLGMAGGRFEAELTPAEKPASYGLESVQFLVAPHPGASARAIDKIASGGELSRLSLAIAVTTSALGQAPTLVFDEVDSGIGGSVAATVGEMLAALGAERQVLCVTHLAQVAACANSHLVVDKRIDERGRTMSAIKSACGEARVTEIARMLGGQSDSPISREHAAHLLRGSEPQKNEGESRKPKTKQARADPKAQDANGTNGSNGSDGDDRSDPARASKQARRS